MDADYSQIELRVLAHMSGDAQLIEAYQMDEDIHRITASKVFHTPFEEVTELQRRNAKAVNFGIVYGISSFGLSQDLSISKKEAAEYIEQYFATYPEVKKFLDKTVEDAKQNGYVTTMYGRRRPIPELSSNNFMQRSFGERVAMNSPIQGTAADIMKIAMIRVWERLHREGMRSRLILQVHDELLIETLSGEEEQVRGILEQEMTHAAELAVKLEIDLHTGSDWYEARAAASFTDSKAESASARIFANCSFMLKLLYLDMNKLKSVHFQKGLLQSGHFPSGDGNAFAVLAVILRTSPDVINRLPAIPADIVKLLDPAVVRFGDIRNVFVYLKFQLQSAPPSYSGSLHRTKNALRPKAGTKGSPSAVPPAFTLPHALKTR